MKLYCKRYSEQGEPLLILHGLFGNQGNWAAHARELAADFAVIAVDLRNHGRSAWDPRHDYPALAQDLVDTLDDLGLARAHFIAHSMGGKAAMCLAFRAPQRVGRLVLVDIAPVAYPGQRFAPLDGMLAVDLTSLHTRQDADAALAAHVPEKPVRDFLLTNLQREADGRYGWRCNLPVLAEHFPEIKGEPGPLGCFDGDTLFIKGEQSDYILPEHWETLQRAFPKARIKVVGNAGHWVHSEKPQLLLKLARDFLLA